MQVLGVEKRIQRHSAQVCVLDPPRILLEKLYRRLNERRSISDLLRQEISRTNLRLIRSRSRSTTQQDYTTHCDIAPKHLLPPQYLLFHVYRCLKEVEYGRAASRLRYAANVNSPDVYRVKITCHRTCNRAARWRRFTTTTSRSAVLSWDPRARSQCILEPGLRCKQRKAAARCHTACSVASEFWCRLCRCSTPSVSTASQNPNAF